MTPKTDLSASLRLNQSSFGHSVEVIRLLYYFSCFCCINLAVLNANFKSDCGITIDFVQVLKTPSHSIPQLPFLHLLMLIYMEQPSARVFNLLYLITPSRLAVLARQYNTRCTDHAVIIHLSQQCSSDHTPATAMQQCSYTCHSNAVVIIHLSQQCNSDHTPVTAMQQ